MFTVHAGGGIIKVPSLRNRVESGAEAGIGTEHRPAEQLLHVK